MHLIFFFIALGLIFLLGGAIWSTLSRRVNVLRDLPEFFLFGLGGITLIMLGLSLFSIPFSRASLSLLVIIVILLLLKHEKVNRYRDNFRIDVSKASLFWIFLLTGLIVIVGIYVFEMPVWGYDAYESWLAHGRAFFVDAGVTKRGIYAFWPYDNGILWSISAAYIYTFLGRDSELLVQVVPFLAYIMLTFILSRELVKKWPKLWGGWVLGFVSLPMVLEQVGDLSGNTDLLVAVYILLGGVYLEKKQLLIASLLFGFAGMTKNDALPAALMGVLLMIFLLRKQYKKISIALVPILSLVFFRLIFKLSSRYLLITKRDYVTAFIYIMHAFREEFRFYSRWAVIWWVIIAMLIITFSYWRKYWKSYLIIMVQLASYIFVFITTPEPSVEGHVASAIFRLLLQVLPLLYLVVLFQVKDFGGDGRVNKADKNKVYKISR